MLEQNQVFKWVFLYFAFSQSTLSLYLTMAVCPQSGHLHILTPFLVMGIIVVMQIKQWRIITIHLQFLCSHKAFPQTYNLLRTISRTQKLFQIPLYTDNMDMQALLYWIIHMRY